MERIWKVPPIGLIVVKATSGQAPRYWWSSLVGSHYHAASRVALTFATIAHSEMKERTLSFFSLRSAVKNIVVLLFIVSAGAQVIYGTTAITLAAEKSILPRQRLDTSSLIYSAQIVDLANKERIAAGLPRLLLNQTLVASAQLKATDMTSKGYFAHNSPNGTTPWYWFRQAGYNFLYAGENLAVNFNTPSDINTAWMGSPRHKANILDKNFTEIGVATSRGTYKGKEVTFVVQVFGSLVPELPTVVVPQPHIVII